MIKPNIIFCLTIFLCVIFGIDSVQADTDTRSKAIKFLRSVGLNEQLNAPVKVSADANGIIFIADQGTYFYQYLIIEPNQSADANIIIDPNLKIPSSCNKAVIVTHGWFDKALSDWPADIAVQIAKKIDPNQWLCVIFDWRGGANVLNPLDAAKYARDIAGPRLAKALLKIKPDLQHLHLIGHSAGCWGINSAAEIIAQKTNAQIHLTFLDAYVPPFWNEDDFAKIDANNTVWAEHYYTKDITLASTQEDLSMAHNVDITDIDPFFKEHKFPYRWYYATVAGRYRVKDWEKNDKVITGYKDLDYGFARSAEAGEKNWQKSLTLKKGNKAVKLKKQKKKLFDLNIFKPKEKTK